MPPVSINQQPLSKPRLVPMAPGARDTARATLETTKDGYDTVGVRFADGKEALILSQSSRKLLFTDRVEIDGQVPTVTFVENEINTRSEHANDLLNHPAAKVVLGVGLLAGVGWMGVAAASGSFWGLLNIPIIAGVTVVGLAAVVGGLAIVGALRGGHTPTVADVAERAAEGK